MSKIIRLDGEVNKVMRKMSTIGKTDMQGNPLPYCVAIVVACVKHYRKFHMPIKNVYLEPILYLKFRDWVRAHCTEEQADLLTEKNIREGGITFDSVAVREQSIVSLKEITWDFYPVPKNEA